MNVSLLPIFLLSLHPMMRCLLPPLPILLSLHPMMCCPLPPLHIFLLSLHPMICCPLLHSSYFCCHFIQWCAARYPTAHTCVVTSSNGVQGVLPVTPLPILLLSLHPMMCWMFCPLSHCPYFLCHFIQWCAGCSACYPTAPTSFVTSSNDVLGVLPVTPLPISVVVSSTDVLSVLPVTPLPILLLSLHPMLCWVFCPEMMYKAWSNIEEVPYCFSSSSVKFQGHTGQKIADFYPN